MPTDSVGRQMQDVACTVHNQGDRAPRPAAVPVSLSACVERGGSGGVRGEPGTVPRPVAADAISARAPLEARATVSRDQDREHTPGEDRQQCPLK